MDLKKEIVKILDVYGCLDIYDDNKFGEKYNQERNDQLVNDLFALYGVMHNVNCEHKHTRSAQCEVDYCEDCKQYIPY